MFVASPNEVKQTKEATATAAEKEEKEEVEKRRRKEIECMEINKFLTFDDECEREVRICVKIL